MQTSKWRLIVSPAANGPYNMALDEAILECVGERLSPPTLRLYSLGHLFQYLLNHI